MTLVDVCTSPMATAKVSFIIVALTAKLSFISTVVAQTACTDTTLWAAETARNLTSPGYPNNYPNDTDCQWRIETASTSQVVVLGLLDFSLGGSPPSCLNDYVYIYDGYDSTYSRVLVLCGDVTSAQVTSTGSFMAVVFRSGYSVESRGFKFEYTAQNKSVLCGNATLSATYTPKYITSPGYPNVYPSNMNCQWHISTASLYQVVVLRLLDFNLEGSSPSCLHDNVTIYDGNTTLSSRILKLCGPVLNTQITSTDSYMTVVFQSDGSTELQGFQFEYTSRALSTSVDLSATETAQYIASPGYPNNYSSNTDGLWRISAGLSWRVVLKLLDFTLEYSSSCNYDYVTIYDGPSDSFPRIRKLCGVLSSTQFTSTESYMTVVFHSDGSNNFRGFKFEYMLTNNTTPCTGTTLEASSDVKYLTSPNYPYPHPSYVNCQWHIEADSDSSVVVLTVKMVDLAGNMPDCISDYVKIYDGPSTDSALLEVSCGIVYYDRFESTSSDMTIVFHSEEENSYHRGFRFAYESKPSTDSSSVSSSTVIAIGVCGVVGTFVLMSYLVWIRRRMTRNIQSRASSAANARESQLSAVSHVANNQGTLDSTNMEMLGSQTIFDPPPYSSLNFSVKDILPIYTPREPGNSTHDLPPPYSSDLPAGTAQNVEMPLLNDLRRGESRTGLESTPDSQAHVNRGFSFRGDV